MQACGCLHVHVCVKVFTCVRACVFMSARSWMFVCVFGGCVVSAYAFMSVVSVYVCECVRACVNFVSNVTQIYSKLVTAKK